MLQRIKLEGFVSNTSEARLDIEDEEYLAAEVACGFHKDMLVGAAKTIVQSKPSDVEVPFVVAALLNIQSIREEGETGDWYGAHNYLSTWTARECNKQHSFSTQKIYCALWFMNKCIVKSLTQSAMETLKSNCKKDGKSLVVTGCVSQGSRDLKVLEGISIIGVQQIDHVVEVLQETLKGPTVRKNKFIEILPIYVGCLGASTYCKIQHGRGHLGSYIVDGLVECGKTVIHEGVEMWKSREDTGAYGSDSGVHLPILITALVEELPQD
ncbi:uncharacterized protein [Aristolochia californica]|uniref:uncharacterized protein n=1 Tax=Aristolochia californica TaxID=171875 RepID=UPI0035DA8FB0